MKKFTDNEHRPSKAERDELRRLQILSAMRRCALRQGFHAASMSQIAAEAELSVGQIYRYYPSKTAIIEDLVRRQVDEQLAFIVSTAGCENHAGRLAGKLLGECLEDSDEQMLYLEMMAEASRNPDVRSIMQAADLSLKNQAVSVLKGDFPHLSEEELQAITTLVASLGFGSSARFINFGINDKDRLLRIYTDAIAGLFEPQQHTSGAQS